MSENHGTSEDELEEKDLILNLSLCGLGFEAMLRSAISSKKKVKKAGSQKTELWCTTRIDALAENDMPHSGSAPVSIRMNTPQVMYGEDGFQVLVLSYCFETHIKQEDAQLVQIEEVAGLLMVVITSTMVELASFRQRLQHIATDWGQEMASKVILSIEELDGKASTYLEHAMHLVASYFNSLSEKKGGSEQMVGINQWAGWYAK